MTIAVIPLTLAAHAVRYHYQNRRVFQPLGLRARRDRLCSSLFVVVSQLFMSTFPVIGFARELSGRNRRWKCPAGVGPPVGSIAYVTEPSTTATGTGGASSTGGAPRPGRPCVACGAPVATSHAAPGGPVWLCPPCAATADLGCP